jgi:hypothetical protein
MKRTILILVIALVLGLTSSVIGGEAQMGPGMMGPGMMGRDMGPGMMDREMMGSGYERQYGPQYGPRRQQPDKPLEEKDARAILQNYLQSMRNPNLKLGKIKDIGIAFEAEILTKDDSLVDEILVDKNTGSMHSVY